MFKKTAIAFALGLLISAHSAFGMEPEDQGTNALTTYRSMPDLPHEVWMLVLSNLDHRALRYCSVCIAWNETIPLVVTSLDREEDLWISNNQLKRLGNLTSLNADFFFTEIANDGVKGLTNLTSLGLVGNYHINDQGISLLTNLIFLDLPSNNRITDDGISQLHNLTWLNLARNDKISDQGISSLTKLKSLDLDMNRIITDVGISLCTNLTWLDLGFNNMITNEGISQFTNLTLLKFQENDVITLEGINPLTRLKCLDIGPEYIFVKNFEKCTNLKEIYLNKKEIIKWTGRFHAREFF